MLINAINESFHTCFIIFSFPLWLISLSILLVVFDFIYTFSSSPHCSSLLFLHHFLRGQYPAIYFYVFWNIYIAIFLCTNLSIIYLFVYLSRCRPLHQSIFPFLSLIPCFFPSSLFPSLLPLYLLTSLPSFFPILT